MRKRNIIKVADTIYWYVIYLMPIFVFLAVLISYIVACNGLPQSGIIADLQGAFSETQAGQSGSITAFQEWWADPWLDAYEDGWLGVMDVLNGVTEGWMDAQLGSPVGQALYSFNENYLTNGYGADVISGFAMCSLTWFINATLIHLAVDFILFIPRICHKWLGKATQED